MGSRLRVAVGRRPVSAAIDMAVAVATASSVLTTSTVVQDTALPTTWPVQLSAVVTPGSATNWSAEGIDKFYGLDWNTMYGTNPDVYGPTVVVNFHLLRDWIQIADIDAVLKANADERNVVLTSGRGAGNASALIGKYVRNGDPTLYETDWILDNNIDRPNGGYASRLPFFALVVVNPIPTPTDTGAPIIDVGYEYAWNSDVPLYVTNPLALLNSITEYVYRYRKQDATPLPAELLNPDGSVNYSPAQGPGHYIVHADGSVSFEPLSPDNTTVYVTYEDSGLALLRPIRDFGGKPGEIVADLIEPTLKLIVDAGYPDNNPLSPPDVYTPMRLLPPPKVVLTAAKGLPAAIARGIQAAKADCATTGLAVPSTSARAVTVDRPRPGKAVASTVVQATADQAQEARMVDNKPARPVRTPRQRQAVTR